MSNKEFDQDKEFLALHEKYQAESTEVPPESIDISIINAAHSAVNSQHETNNDIVSARLKKRKKHAWYVPVSYVAVMVLSLSVFLKLIFESEQLEPAINGADFAEDAYLPDVGRQSADKSFKVPGEQEEIKEKSQQQTTDLLKERQEEVARARKKTRTETDRRLQLKHQGTVPVLKEPARVIAPVTTPVDAPVATSAATQVKVNAVNESAGAAAEMPAPKPLMSLSSYDQQAESDAEPLNESAAQQTSVRANNEHQQVQIKNLIMLYESKQLDKLKAALALYRKDYPYNKQTDLLPQAIREQEISWQTEKQAESLHN